MTNFKMKKWLLVIIFLNLTIFAVIFVGQYYGIKYGNWPSSQKRISLTPKEKQAMAKRFGVSLGGSWTELSDKELNNELDDIVSVGFTWIRFDINWGHVQPENEGTFHWEKFDRIVIAANKRKLKMLPILTYAPEWTANRPYQNNYMSPSSNREKFANFAQKTVKRYAPLGVHVWEIWNEPNLKGLWEPAPNPKDYADLLKKSYLKIKQADPQAIVISGGLAALPKNVGKSISGLNFLEGLYGNGAKNYFDAVGYHPFSFPQLPSAMISPNGWAQMTRPFLKSVRSIMIDNGDKNKQVWATEFGMPNKGINNVSESLQAKMVQDVVGQMETKPWIKVLFWYSYKDISGSPVPAENYFGIVRRDGTRKPAYYALKKLLKTPEF